MAEDCYIAGNPPLNGTASLVVVSGCSGGGKSALLDEMQLRGFGVRPEPGRQIVKEQAYIGGDGLPWVDPARFVELCISRAVHFYNTVRPEDGLVLFDRSLVDAVSTLSQLGLTVRDDHKAVLKKYRYAGTVFMAPPWEDLFENDAERKHSFADAVREYEILMESYPANGYTIIELPRIGIEQRADFLEERFRDKANG